MSDLFLISNFSEIYADDFFFFFFWSNSVPLLLHLFSYLFFTTISSSCWNFWIALSFINLLSFSKSIPPLVFCFFFFFGFPLYWHIFFQCRSSFLIFFYLPKLFFFFWLGGRSSIITMYRKSFLRNYGIMWRGMAPRYGSASPNVHLDAPLSLNCTNCKNSLAKPEWRCCELLQGSQKICWVLTFGVLVLGILNMVTTVITKSFHLWNYGLIPAMY